MTNEEDGKGGSMLLANPSAPGRLGKATPRPAAEVLREYMDYHAKSLALNPSLREILEKRDAPEQKYRWLVELDCGCITEALTGGEDQLPATGVAPHRLGDRDKEIHPACAQTYLMSHNSVRADGSPFPPGLLWCSDHDEELPWREITKWLKRKEVARHYSGRTDKLIGPYASWTVELSCGHRGTTISDDVNWIPEYGHRENREVVEKLNDRLLAAADDGQAERVARIEWHIRMVRMCPPTEQECPKCVYQRRITAQRLVGPLPRPRPQRRSRPAPAPKPGALRQAEAKIRGLQKELAEAEAEAGRLRGSERVTPD